jgi:peptidyl-prolyl cis-trans isomerase A (cyclophilin A)
LGVFQNDVNVHKCRQNIHMYRVFVLAVFLALSAAPCFAYRVKFDVSVPSGDASFIMNVDPEWAPIGAARFKELVQSKFFDGCRFFRVIPGFMAQIGINGDPAISAEWRAKTINDEAVLKSNLRGYVSFAKTGAPNSRTTQFFINYGDNSRLDGMGFAPFGIIEDTGALSIFIAR